VDGILDEPSWEQAPRYGDFLQRDPDEGRAASQPTEFRVLYTDKALLIGVRAYDADPAGITKVLARRDDWAPADEITVMVDSYLDRRTGFSFSVNAAGVKRDAYLFDDYDQDGRWDAVWDVATRVDSLGWVAEFQIPWSQLRFPGGGSHRFGFNVSRRINRLNETQFWRLPRRNQPGFVSRFGELSGIDGIAPGRRLELLPYTAAQSAWRPSEAGNPFRTGQAGRAAIGGDLKMGVSSALTLTATVNPDFGQVEADPAVVNLSAFETFFSERRPFFTEGLDVFRFRLSEGDGDNANEELFYTRRIGRTPQGLADPRNGFAESIDQTTILGAGKLSGKTRSGWTIGLLGALTAREDAQVLDGLGQWHRDPVEPRTQYGVGRVAKEFRGGQTVISLIGTTVHRDLAPGLDFLHSSASAGGLSWQHRFAHDSYQLSGRLVGSGVQGSAAAIAATQTSSARYFQRPDAEYVEVDSSRTSLGGYTAGLNGGRTSGNWRWNLGVDARSPGFEVNDIGFMRETDRISQHIWVNRRWLTPNRVFRRLNLNLNQWAGWNFGGERRFGGGNLNLNYTLRNYWYGWLGFNRNIHGLDPIALRGGPSIRSQGTWNGWLGFGTDERKPLRANLNGWGWKQDQTGSTSGGLSLNLWWRPAGGVDLMVAPSINRNHDQLQYLSTATIDGRAEYFFGEIRQTTAAMTVRSNLTFSPALTLQLYAQPFVSAGQYRTVRRVVTPRSPRFTDQFNPLDPTQLSRDDEGNLLIDLAGSGQPAVTIPNPDFRVLSLRSNVVLRWEYQPGSTVFLVWQHGRSGYQSDGSFHLGGSLGELFRSPAENLLLIKLNYWLGL
jgi:hypothetical protein